MKNKSKINFIIDVLMFIVMMAMGGIGFLMKFILVPGSEKWEIYGSNVDLFVWGWDRHQWGGLHLILGYILLGLLVLHIVFHWKQIKSMFKNLIHKKSLRIVLAFIFVIMGLLSFIFAFIVDVDVAFTKQGERGRRVERSRPEVVESTVSKQDRSASNLPSGKVRQEEENVHQETSVQVYGTMSLKEVENKYDVPADSIKKFLGIPLSTSDNENLGWLRRRYGFNMSDIGRFIEKYKGEKEFSEVSGKEKDRPEKRHEDTEPQHEYTIDVNGRMTLRDVENQYKVPADSLKKYLGLPMSISDYEILGRLRRWYGFNMSDIERFIQEYRQ